MSGTIARKQINERLNDMNRIGKSRHKDKQREGRFTDGINSIKTYKSYKKIYINQLNDEGKAAATIKQKVAALNKLFALNKNPPDKKIRMPSNIKNKTKTKNQIKRTYTKEFEKAHEREFNFCQAFGVRTGTVTQFSKENIRYDEKNQLLILHVKGDKGGRDRDVICLPDYQDYIYEWWEGLNDGEKFINKIDARIDYQDMRIGYAKNMYELLEREPELKPRIYNALKLKKIYASTEKLIPRKKNYKQFRKIYNKENLYLTSKNLGHNRIDVIYQNYLNKQN